MAQQIVLADVVHIPQPGDMSFLAMVVALLLRKRLFARYCGSWVTNSETTTMNKLTRALMRFFAGGRCVMIATGIGTTPPAANMHWVFATAISRGEVAAVCPDLDRPASQPLKMVYVGRLSPEKGTGFLVNAVSQLRENNLDERCLQLTIIGDGPQRAELEALVEKERCSGMVSFTGHLNRSDLINHLLNSDVCVLPSLSEGYPKARLDAMLCGVPIITTEAGSGRQMVGADGTRGWIVPPSNISALAMTIKKVLDGTPDWPAMRRRCREYAQVHTLEVWAQQIGEICAQQWRLSFVNGRLDD